MLCSLDAIHWFRRDHAVRNLDVAGCGHRVRASVTRGFHQGPGRFLVHADQADFQPSRQSYPTNDRAADTNIHRDT